jgi:NAD+ kinase
MKTEELRIRDFGFFLRPNRPELYKTYSKLKMIFERFGAKVYLDKDSAEMVGESGGVDAGELCEKSDILVTLGGDGTLLSTVRKSFQYDKPILPINAGNLGFLVDLDPDEVENFAIQLFNKQFSIEERKMLKLQYGELTSYAFNDFVVTSQRSFAMLNVNVYTKRGLLNNYYGDGLVLSTPTGSTAYNLSSGGSILHPLIDGFILTPISPHSLTQRPIVLSSSFNISVGVDNRDSVIVVDGQEQIELKMGDRVKIGVSEESVKIIRDKNYNFFDTLRKKLKWGDKVL